MEIPESFERKINVPQYVSLRKFMAHVDRARSYSIAYKQTPRPRFTIHEQLYVVFITSSRLVND